jgi:hypothetical protein
MLKKIKPEWVSPDTLIDTTTHPTAEAWVEEHENPDGTGETICLAIDTSGCDGGIIGVFSNFADACNAVGEAYGFSDLWTRED